MSDKFRTMLGGVLYGVTPYIAFFGCSVLAMSIVFDDTSKVNLGIYSCLAAATGLLCAYHLLLRVMNDRLAKVEIGLSALYAGDPELSKKAEDYLKSLYGQLNQQQQ